MKTNLPSITAPVYRDVLPSNEQEFTYRPFLVREEKLLQLIKDDGDLKQIYIELNFNQLGKEELSKLIKTIKNRLKARITNISIRSDKASKLAIGLIHMEFITK